MQRKKNDVKARTTLLPSLHDEHQLRFSKYKTAKELWAVILKTFGGNEATKKRKKNLLKQQYGNFKAEGSETLEQTFNRLQVIVSQLQFMDVEVEKDDLNQKFLTSLAPEWLMHTIVWRNMNDLDTMSLDDLYNHLKVYEAEVQTKSNSNSQNTAFISSTKNSSGNEDDNIACVSTSSTIFPTTSSRRGLERRLAFKDLMWQGLTNQKLSVSTVTRWVISQESVEHPEVRKEEGKKVIDRGYNVVPPPAADLYLSPKKDLSWTGLPEFVDDTVTDYIRPSPTVASTSAEGQNKDSFTSEDVASPNTPKPFVKFVKPKDSQSERVSRASITDNGTVWVMGRVVRADLWARLYTLWRTLNFLQPIKSNTRLVLEIKNIQHLLFWRKRLGPEFVLNKKACYNYGDFSHLANDCRKRVQRETSRSQNHAYMGSSHRSAGHRPHGAPMRPPHKSVGHRPHGPSMRPSNRPAGYRPHGLSMNPIRPNMNGARPNKSFLSRHLHMKPDLFLNHQQ
nr:hypothetical protein [Tanacetum cinerariifolium]